MTTFRCHFTDGDVIDVTAANPNKARDEARRRKGRGIVSKVKRVRQVIAEPPPLAPDLDAPRIRESF